MTLPPVADFTLSPADSARAAASVYTASILVTLPIVAALAGAFALRRASPAARVLLWRAAIVVLLLAFVGRAAPLRWSGWSVPSLIAEPLVALGRIQVGDVAANGAGGAARGHAFSWIQLALAVYVAGVVVVLVPTIAGSVRARRIVRRARSVDDGSAWHAALADARATLAIHRPVRLAESAEVDVPATWGLVRPVVLVPSSPREWTEGDRGLALRHELAHVEAADWTFGVAARIACALYWFHPGVWSVARGLRSDAERATDDRVLASGAVRSDYAELLMKAAAVGCRAPSATVGLSSRGGLRARLSAIVDERAVVPPLSPRWRFMAGAACLAVAAPLSTMELSPSRDLLATLMRDSRWESRAYAVIGLAHRPDTVAVARTAAELDPSPRVRAWARYALGLTEAPTPPVVSR